MKVTVVTRKGKDGSVGGTKVYDVPFDLTLDEAIERLGEAGIIQAATCEEQVKAAKTIKKLIRAGWDDEKIQKCMNEGHLNIRLARGKKTEAQKLITKLIKMTDEEKLTAIELLKKELGLA